MTNAKWKIYLEKVHLQVGAWGGEEVNLIAKRIAASLSEIGASGIFGGDYRFPTLWEEYCFFVQEGPIDFPRFAGLPSIEDAWEMTIDQEIGFALVDIPDHVKSLLSVHAAFDMEQDESVDVGVIWHDGLVKATTNELRHLAAMENLDPFC